ncbi:jasmonate-zim-domain protein 3 [Rhynchospora pubera]|uniref:Protein TIFY n=1 Tax=Rhynchospora pubera TaxID=906938 RepID=A0AAV8HNC5_9POAL|nr:jasmonate-zim-domain protein 3 [Rhynchospora pubera]KAJ4816731.1 jasmonate-zim-domain protein 3 [Rhynchospora pubera]
MERDFLGINAKLKLEMESPPPRDEAKAPNSATYGNTGSQWNFTNKEQPRHFLSFTRQQEGQSSQFSPLTFKRSLVLDTDRSHQSQSTTQYVTEIRPAYANLGPFGSASTSLTPRTGPFVGLYHAREVPKHLPQQLTIFYGGSVSVFDNVPLDKAKEIMSLANKASSIPCTPTPALQQPTKLLSKSASFSGGIVTGPNPKPTQKADHVFEPVMLPPPVLTQISITPHASPGSSPMSVVTTESLKSGPRSDAPVTTAATVSPASPNVPRAIPQARKASLARFLEKRKERVIAANPYPSTTKSAEDLPSKSSSTDVTFSSNNNKSLCAGPPKINCYREEYPSTKLEI